MMNPLLALGAGALTTSLVVAAAVQATAPTMPATLAPAPHARQTPARPLIEFDDVAVTVDPVAEVVRRSDRPDSAQPLALREGGVRLDVVEGQRFGGGLGPSATYVVYPFQPPAEATADRPIRLTRFQLQDADAWRERHHVIESPQGFVLLDQSVYERTAEDGFTLYSEPNNPDADTIRTVLETLAQRFPDKHVHGPVEVVSILNARETYWEEDGAEAPMREGSGTGVEMGQGLGSTGSLVVLVSETGNALLHRLHELGNLYRGDEPYAHGLTWFVAYDLYPQLGPAEDRAANEQVPIRDVVSLIERASDPTRTVREVLESRQDGGLPPPAAFNAWISGGLWTRVQEDLVQADYPSVYDLIGAMHRRQPAQPNRRLEVDLDAVKALYRDLLTERYADRTAAWRSDAANAFERSVEDWFETPIGEVRARLLREHPQAAPPPRAVPNQASPNSANDRRASQAPGADPVRRGLRGALDANAPR